MTPERLPQDLVDKLNAPLPAEAIKAHPTKKFLSTIKTIYQIERLNEVFGVNGWTAKSEIVEQGTPMIIMKVTLKIPAYGIDMEQYGGNDNPDRGDAYKGAFTDALSKICGYLGIGMAIYKGEGPTVSNPEGNKPAYDKMRQQADARQAARQAAAGDAIKAAGSVVEVTGPGLPPPYDKQLKESLASIPPKKLAPKKRTAKQINVLEWFGPMHDKYKELGDENRYYEVLWAWGVNKSTEFNADNDDGYAQAIKCRNDMQIDLQNFEVEVKKAKENNA